MSELHKPRETMSTRDVSRLCEVSKQTVHRWRRAGLLPETKKRPRGNDGAYWFDTWRVEALLYQRTGQRMDGGALARYVYGLFDEGKTRNEVVMEARLDPERVWQLWLQYRGVDDKFLPDASYEPYLKSVLDKHGLRADSPRDVVQLLDKAHERIKELSGMLLALKEPPPSSRAA